MMPDMNMLMSEFKRTAEARAIIVLNGMGKNPPTTEDFVKAAMSCALNDPHMGHAEAADWRLYIAAVPEPETLGEPTADIHLPRWLVDTVANFVTDDELDTIIGETPCKKWVVGITALAESLPETLRNQGTIDLCRKLEDGAEMLPPETEKWIEACLKLKVDAVREARKNAPAEHEPDGDTVVVAIIER